MRVIIIIVFFIISIALSWAEEVNTWREMKFNAPSIECRFAIDAGRLSPEGNDEISKWNGKLTPRFIMHLDVKSDLDDFFPIIINCSQETYLYAFSITDKKRASILPKEDIQEYLSPEKCTNLIFRVGIFENTMNPKEPSYEVAITKEEFINLVNMILKDISEQNSKMKNPNGKASEKALKTKSLLENKIQNLKLKK